MGFLDDLLSRYKNYQASAIQAAKKATGNEYVDLMSGDINKQLTGIPAQDVYGLPPPPLDPRGTGYESAGGGVLDDTNFNTGGGTTLTGNQVTNPSPTGDVGGNIEQNFLDIIGKRLEEIKGFASRQRDRAGELKEGALGDIRDTTSMIKGRARQTAGDFERKSRIRARALGSKGSAYEQMQTRGDNALARSLGGINLDEASGRRSVFDRYAESIDRADELESAGVSDYGTDINSALGRIQAKQDAMERANSMLASISGQYTGAGGENKLTELLSTLNSLQGFSPGTADTSVDQGGNLVSPVDYLTLKKDLDKKSLFSQFFG